MGSWNHTCFLSNMSVSRGEEVVVMILQDNKHYDSYATPVTYWAPAPVFFYGKYNDYGGVEDCYGSQLEYILDEYRNNVVESEGRLIGTSTTRGKVSRENFGTDELFDADHEGVLNLATPNGFKRALGGEKCPWLRTTHSVMRKDVFDAMLDRYSFEVYTGQEQPYTKINYSLLCREIPGYVKILKDFYNTDDIMNLFERLPKAYRYEDNCNYLAVYACSMLGDRREFFHKSFLDRIKLLATENRDDELVELLTEFAKYIILYIAIDDARRCFIRPSVTSQEISHKAQCMFAQITLDVAAEQQRKWDLEDYPEDAWDPKHQVYMEQCELTF